MTPPRVDDSPTRLPGTPGCILRHVAHGADRIRRRRRDPRNARPHRLSTPETSEPGTNDDHPAGPATGRAHQSVNDPSGRRRCGRSRACAVLPRAAARSMSTPSPGVSEATALPAVTTGRRGEDVIQVGPGTVVVLLLDAERGASGVEMCGSGGHHRAEWVVRGGPDEMAFRPPRQLPRLGDPADDAQVRPDEIHEILVDQCAKLPLAAELLPPRRAAPGFIDPPTAGRADREVGLRPAPRRSGIGTLCISIAMLP